MIAWVISSAWWRYVRVPLSVRPYLKHIGLRTTIASIIASLAAIQVTVSSRCLTVNEPKIALVVSEDSERWYCFVVSVSECVSVCLCGGVSKPTSGSTDIVRCGPRCKWLQHHVIHRQLRVSPTVNLSHPSRIPVTSNPIPLDSRIVRIQTSGNPVVTVGFPPIPSLCRLLDCTADGFMLLVVVITVCSNHQHCSPLCLCRSQLKQKQC